jgi:NDP-4-keto-2,6-dideoxyhexose 3-C-methyltransferase|tara:strand:- start:140 stop:1405 length:1266 start_codon:yes stop_codon:yes gene_type:complete
MQNCVNCKKKKLKKIITIGSQPISGVFLKKKTYNLKKYPLDLYECQKCKLVQITKIPKSNEMFGTTYEYRTSLSKLMNEHISNKSKFLLKKKFVNNNSKILDIGSNDGTFLNEFSKNKSLYGIDPSAKKFKKYYNKKIKIIFDYFSKKNVEKFTKKKIYFDVISSFAMFYDVRDPNTFCSDIEKLLTKDGVWILELSYLPLFLKNLSYDQICHEHVAYYSLTVFKKIIEKNGLKIIDFTLNEINGGSIEIICSKKNSKYKEKKSKIKNILKDEKKINKKSFINFNERVNKTKLLLQMFLKLKSNKKVIAYGASTKGNIVLNHCQVTNTQIKEVCDGSKKKISKFTPGTNLKIISKETMRSKKPDYLLVLIWSFRREVIKQEIKYLQDGGKLVFLLPKFHIINKENFQQYINSSFKNLSYDY